MTKPLPLPNMPEVELTHCSECGRKITQKYMGRSYFDRPTYRWVGHLKGCKRGHRFAGPDKP